MNPPSGIAIAVCEGCGHAIFPPRPICPRCAGTEWGEKIVRRGTVEEVTERRHRTREARRMPVGGWNDFYRVPIASVRTEAGPVVVAWAPDGAAPGAEVRLETSSGAPVARPPGEGAP